MGSQVSRRETSGIVDGTKSRPYSILVLGDENTGKTKFINFITDVDETSTVSYRKEFVWQGKYIVWTEAGMGTPLGWEFILSCQANLYQGIYYFINDYISLESLYDTRNTLFSVLLNKSMRRWPVCICINIWDEDVRNKYALPKPSFSFDEIVTSLGVSIFQNRCFVIQINYDEGAFSLQAFTALFNFTLEYIVS